MVDPAYYGKHPIEVVDYIIPRTLWLRRLWRGDKYYQPTGVSYVVRSINCKLYGVKLTVERGDGIAIPDADVVVMLELRRPRYGCAQYTWLWRNRVYVEIQ